MTKVTITKELFKEKDSERQVTIEIDGLRGMHGEPAKKIILSKGDYFKFRSGKMISWNDFFPI